MTKYLPTLILLLLLAAGNTTAQNELTGERHIYVSPQGNDASDGTAQAPLKTFQAAQHMARQAHGPVSVWFDDGIYYLGQTVRLDSRDNHISFHALHPQKAIISGGERLFLKWHRGKDGIWWARVQDDLPFDQFFVNGERKRMARYPNASDRPDANVFDRWTLYESRGAEEVDALDSARTARWKNPAGGYVHAMHEYLWGDMHWLITGRDENGLQMEGGWQNNRPSKMHPRFRIVENIREELDVPGEWFYDQKSRRLLYMPEEGEDLQKAVVEVAGLERLLEIQGTSDEAVRNVTLDGFVFRHAARTFMQNKDRLLRSDWTICRSAAVTLQNAEDCLITNCDFDQVGGNAILVNHYNRDIVVRSCHIYDAGANGIAFVGDTASVRNPFFDYARQATEVTDHTPGPRTDNYPRHCLVEDCLISRPGRTEKQTAAVQISMSFGIRVNHCSVYGTPRAGINISEGTFGGHVIENCDVFDTVLETGDHGSFNSWGRDRYWSPSVPLTSELLGKHPEWKNMDMLERNVLRHNRWRCDHGWDVDLDDGSSNYLICDNLLLGGGLKLREGYNRIVKNNIVINNSLHIHLWYRQSGDIVTHNIVSAGYITGAMNSAMKDDERWGAYIDYNFFTAPEDEARKYLVHDCDSNSLAGNPLFVNPAEGDFRVKPNSPALAVGFRNFSMDDFGVVSPRLKAIARKPSMNIRPLMAEEAETSQIIDGAKWTLVTGNALSAYGIDLNSRGFSVFFEGNHPLASRGLRRGDLLLKLNGRQLTDLNSLQEELRRGISSAELVRNQQRITLPSGEQK